MILDEAQAILDASGECPPLFGMHGHGRVCVDGIYTLQELEALLVIARYEIEKREAKVSAG